LVQHEAVLIERRVLFEGVDVHQQVFLFKQTVAFLDSAFQEPRVDRAFVDFKKRHVVIEDLVQKDDELEEVRIGLLPERLFAAADRSKNSHAGEQAPLGNNQPARVLSWLRPPGMMYFSNHQKQLVAAGDLEISRQLATDCDCGLTKHKDVGKRKRQRETDVG